MTQTIGVNKDLGRSGDSRSINIARSLITSAKRRHRLALISSSVPLHHTKRILETIPDPSGIEKVLVEKSICVEFCVCITFTDFIVYFILK